VAYEYQTPDGYGDIFFVYAFNPAANNLVDGNSYFLLAIPIQDGDFIVRAWAGADTVLTSGVPHSSDGTIQIYDDQLQIWFQLPVSVYGAFSTGQSKVPELLYQNNGFIKFDLTNVELSENS
jgi:hypothetical protein